jgi:flavin-dependent dehydrogenase
MIEKPAYDTAIIGGGLGGLCLAIQLARQGFKIILFEKENYPFHKVCGEYISMESYDFLMQLGLPLPEMNLPFIKKIIVTAPNGEALQQQLDLGGFGISRYTIDNALKEIAVKNKVQIFENCKVDDAEFANEIFTIKTAKGGFTAKTSCGSFGKKSNLDIKWKRPFVKKMPNKLNNYIGIKYHLQIDFPADTIALHNFKNGYCGISKIEENKYCLCYLTNASNLKENNNSIEAMEKNILYNNPHLKNIFLTGKKLYASPLSISQISFQKKSQIQNHVLLIGDAAGMITPLCGNGMSMAMHASKLAATAISGYLNNNTSRTKMENDYQKKWRKAFSKRLRTGRIVQSFFGKITTTNRFIHILKRLPAITKLIIKQTHGKPF